MAWFAALGRRLALQAALGLAAILLALGALGVGLGALHVLLRASLGPAASLSMIAGILVLLALVAGLAVQFMAGRRRRPVTPSNAAEPVSAAILGDLAQGLRGAIAADPAAAVFGALAAGYIAGGRTGPDLMALFQLVAAAQERGWQTEPRRG